MGEKKIYLSEKHGVNPHLTFCPRCGKDGQEIILTGNAQAYKCSHCGQKYVGRPKKCVKCEFHGDLICEGELRPEQKLPGSLCKECETEVANFKAEIDRGGIPFRCKDCGVEGVIKAEHELAKKVRAEYGLVGLEFSKEDCPKCSKA